MTGLNGPAFTLDTQDVAFLRIDHLTIVALLRPRTGVLNNGWVLAALIGALVVATSSVVPMLLLKLRPDV